MTILALDLEAKTTRSLCGTPKSWLGYPIWSRDGAKAYFTDGWQVRMYDPSTGSDTAILKYTRPGSAPSPVSVSPDHRWVVLEKWVREGRRIVLIDPATSANRASSFASYGYAWLDAARLLYLTRSGARIWHAHEDGGERSAPEIPKRIKRLYLDRFGLDLDVRDAVHATEIVEWGDRVYALLRRPTNPSPESQRSVAAIVVSTGDAFGSATIHATILGPGSVRSFKVLAADDFHVYREVHSGTKRESWSYEFIGTHSDRAKADDSPLPNLTWVEFLRPPMSGQ